MTSAARARGVLGVLGVLGGLAAGACGGDDDGGGPPPPRVIPGGGIGDGPIAGTLHVHVIDDTTDAVIAGATVRVGDVEVTTDGGGLAAFTGVTGPQTIVVDAAGRRGTVWVGANGVNVTIPLEVRPAPAIGSATITGTIDGWSSITVPAQHFKAAAVLYSHSDDVGDGANSIPTPNNGNLCFGVNQCAWTLESRTGTVTLIAAIIDRDTKGTASEDDDTNEIIGWAYKAGITVEAGVDQSGQVLQLVEAGNLQEVTVDLGAPPAGLPRRSSLVGIERGADEVIQLPLFLNTVDPTRLLAPRPAVFGADATYRLTAIAQTASGDAGAQSILLRRGLAGPALAAGTWLVPPTGVTATRTSASFQPVAGAAAHQVQWRDATDTVLLEATIFDATTTVDVPALLALPATGALTARASALGADFDVTDFSLAADEDTLWGVASEPVAIP